MLGWGEMPNNWDLLAYQVGLEEPKERCLLSSVNSCAGSIGPVDQADSYGMETMTLASTSDAYLVYVKNSCGIPYSTVAASHITITDGEDTKKTYLDVPIYNQEIYWLIGCIRQDLVLQQTFQLGFIPKQCHSFCPPNNPVCPQCYQQPSSGFLAEATNIMS